MISEAVRLTESMRRSTLVPIHSPPISENSSVSRVAPTTRAKVWSSSACSSLISWPIVSLRPSESWVSATLTGSKARGLPGGRSATSPMLRVVWERTDFNRIGRSSS